MFSKVRSVRMCDHTLTVAAALHALAMVITAVQSLFLGEIAILLFLVIFLVSLIPYAIATHLGKTKDHSGEGVAFRFWFGFFITLNLPALFIHYWATLSFLFS